MAQTGAPWRNLPPSVSDGGNTWGRGAQSTDVFDAGPRVLAGSLRGYVRSHSGMAMLDSASIRAHTSASGQKNRRYPQDGRPAARPWAQPRRTGNEASPSGYLAVPSRVRRAGNALRFVVLPGQRADIRYGPQLIEGLRTGAVVADRGDDVWALVDQIAAMGAVAVIPRRRANRVQRVAGVTARGAVEQCEQHPYTLPTQPGKNKQNAPATGESRSRGVGKCGPSKDRTYDLSRVKRAL